MMRQTSGGRETLIDVLRSDYLHVDYQLQHDRVPLQVMLMTCMGCWIYRCLVSAAAAAAAADKHPTTILSTNI